MLEEEEGWAGLKKKAGAALAIGGRRRTMLARGGAMR